MSKNPIQAELQYEQEDIYLYGDLDSITPTNGELTLRLSNHQGVDRLPDTPAECHFVEQCSLYKVKVTARPRPDGSLALKVHSPVRPVASMREDRIAYHLHVRYRSLGGLSKDVFWNEAITTDLGEGGLGIVTKRPLMPGEAVEMVLEIQTENALGGAASEPQEVTTMARVAHCSVSACNMWRIGFAYSDFPHGVYERLVEMWVAQKEVQGEQEIAA